MKNFLKKICCLIVVVICINLLPLSVFADVGKTEKSLKVAFPIQEGLTMKDEDGNYYGYSYDYLLEISKYTGWTYEIVELEGDINRQAMQALDMLEKGEVDLLGGLNYNETLTEIFTYPGYCYGSNYMGIFVPFESQLSEATLYTTKKNKSGCI